LGNEAALGYLRHPWNFCGIVSPGWRSFHSLTPRYLLSSLPGWEYIPVGRIVLTVCEFYKCHPLQVPDAGYHHVPMPEVGIPIPEGDRLPMPEGDRLPMPEGDRLPMPEGDRLQMPEGDRLQMPEASQRVAGD